MRHLSNNLSALLVKGSRVLRSAQDILSVKSVITKNIQIIINHLEDECFTEIMKFVKIGNKLKTLHRKEYVCNSLLVFLVSMALRNDFLHQCEE